MSDGEPRRTLRIAAVGDLHVSEQATHVLQPIVTTARASADIVLLCGDLTDRGLAEEADLLAKQLANVDLPVLAVLGNHDYEADQQAEITRILHGAGVTVLDGTAIEIEGVGFVGVKGFCGGFGPRALAPWGERIIKAFVRETIEETVKLEAALSKLETPSKVVLLHYSPIQATVEGEPEEIYAFLGSSRLAEVIDRYHGVVAAFHGHAHRGAPHSQTLAGTPVYNVSLPLMRKVTPDGTCCRIVEIPLDPGPHLRQEPGSWGPR